ncbi:class I SAM-dependent methyltransferase [Roseibium sp. M-1]
MATTWSNEKPSSAGFWSRTARKYAASPIRNQAAYEKTLVRTIEHLGPEDSVLELGCGTGSTALQIAGNVRAYLATDFARGMIEIAEGKLEAGKDDGSVPEGLRFAVADAFSEKLEPRDKKGYDAVLAFNFLHLVEEAEDTLIRVNRLLKPGGLFISKTVCLKKRAWLFGPLIKVMQLFGKAPFVRFYSFATLEGSIRSAGFEIIEADTCPAPFSRYVVARKL